MPFYDGWWWLTMLFGGLTMLFLWGGLIVLIIWAVARMVRTPTSEVTPLEIARRRYARGDITREQFEQIKKDLG